MSKIKFSKSLTWWRHQVVMTTLNYFLIYCTLQSKQFSSRPMVQNGCILKAFESTDKWMETTIYWKSVYRYIYIYIYFTTICCKTGVPENPLPDTPEPWNFFLQSIWSGSRRPVKFQISNSILTWFLRHLNMAILGFLPNFV